MTLTRMDAPMAKVLEFISPASDIYQKFHKVLIFLIFPFESLAGGVRIPEGLGKSEFHLFHFNKPVFTDQSSGRCPVTRNP